MASASSMYCSIAELEESAPRDSGRAQSRTSLATSRTRDSFFALRFTAVCCALKCAPPGNRGSPEFRHDGEENRSSQYGRGPDRARFAGHWDRESPPRAIVPTRQFLDDGSRAIGVEQSVAGNGTACGLDRFCQSAPDRAQDERRDFALRRQGKIGGSARKFGAVIQFEPCLA
jgi:hypothetical protein